MISSNSCIVVKKIRPGFAQFSGVLGEKGVVKRKNKGRRQSLEALDLRGHHCPSFVYPSEGPEVEFQKLGLIKKTCF